MGDCSCAPVPVTQDTEGGRIARVLERTRSIVAAQNLAKARAYRGSACRKGDCEGLRMEAVVRAAAVTVPPPGPESARLQAATKACTGYQSPYVCVPESTRIARAQQCVLDKSVNPLDPATRFSEFRGPVIAPVCPPIPQEALNANVPKQNMRNCPLPNKPDNPVLPT